MAIEKTLSFLLHHVPVLVAETGSQRPPHGSAFRAIAISAFMLAFIQIPPALAAAIAPPLGSAGAYTVLGTNAVPTSGTVTCTTSTINGNVGSTFNSITNTACTILGGIDAPVAASVVTDFNNAYSALDSLNPTCDGVIPTTSTVLPPGVYCSAAATTVGAGVTFTLNGSASDVWVFKIGTGGLGALTGTGFSVVMGGSAKACNVYWWTAEGATMTDSSFRGTVLAGTATTMTRGDWIGRAMATTDATLTDASEMTFAGCGPGDSAKFTVTKDFSDDNPMSVTTFLACNTGLPLLQQAQLSEFGNPFDYISFVINDYLPGTVDCNVYEAAPAGYDPAYSAYEGETGVAGDVYDSDGGCHYAEIVAGEFFCDVFNDLQPVDVVIGKEWIDEHPEYSSQLFVDVTLECNSPIMDGFSCFRPVGSSGDDGNYCAEAYIDPDNPGVFEVLPRFDGTICFATEVPVSGAVTDRSDCEDLMVFPGQGAGCVIINTRLFVGIPTLSQHGLILLALMMFGIGAVAWRRFF